MPWVPSDLPVIYLITPTYQRPAQIPELTRMAQTLLNVPAIHWIVVEDANATSPAVAALLSRYGIPHTHLKGLFFMSSYAFIAPAERRRLIVWQRKKEKGAEGFIDSGLLYVPPLLTGYIKS